MTELTPSIATVPAWAGTVVMLSVQVTSTVEAVVDCDGAFDHDVDVRQSRCVFHYFSAICSFQFVLYAFFPDTEIPIPLRTQCGTIP